MKELRVRLPDEFYNELVDVKGGMSWSKFLRDLTHSPVNTGNKSDGDLKLMQDLNNSINRLLDFNEFVTLSCKECDGTITIPREDVPIDYCPYCGEQDTMKEKETKEEAD